MDQEAYDTIISLIKDLQKQVTYMERKVDTLIAQAGERQRPRFDRGSGEFGRKREDEGRYRQKRPSFRPGDRERERGAKKFQGRPHSGQHRGHHREKY